MADESLSERPKIYVTRRGGLYVKAGELLHSKRARAIIDKMASLSAHSTQIKDEGSQENYSKKTE